MTRAMLIELSVVFALESCDATDDDEAMRLDAIANELRARAEALGPRAVALMTTSPSAT